MSTNDADFDADTPVTLRLASLQIISVSTLQPSVFRVAGVVWTIGSHRLNVIRKQEFVCVCRFVCGVPENHLSLGWRHERMRPLLTQPVYAFANRQNLHMYIWKSVRIGYGTFTCTEQTNMCARRCAGNRSRWDDRLPDLRVWRTTAQNDAAAHREGLCGWTVHIRKTHLNSIVFTKLGVLNRAQTRGRMSVRDVCSCVCSARLACQNRHECEMSQMRNSG